VSRQASSGGAVSGPTAADVDRRLRALTDHSVGGQRAVRRQVSAELKAVPAEDVVALADELVDRHRWVAYELVYHHRGALDALDDDRVVRFGRGMEGWDQVDAYGRYISGPAWRIGVVDDELIHGWTRDPSRWWRRAALVSTVPLNLRAAGGTGDTARTLAVCRLLVADRDDMVVKALSWALRALAVVDPAAARAFLAEHEGAVAARVRREVTAKLDTGRKHPRRSSGERR
jgi:3-methyladenine DNA glycosylase AlkD